MKKLFITVLLSGLIPAESFAHTESQDDLLRISTITSLNNSKEAKTQSKYSKIDFIEPPIPEKTLQELLLPNDNSKLKTVPKKSSYSKKYSKNSYYYEKALYLIYDGNPKKVREGIILLHKIANDKHDDVYCQDAKYQLLCFNSLGSISYEKDWFRFPSLDILKLTPDIQKRTYKIGKKTYAIKLNELPRRCQAIFNIFNKNINIQTLSLIESSFYKAIAYEYYLRNKDKDFSTIKAPDIRKFISDKYRYYKLGKDLDKLPGEVAELALLYPYISMYNHSDQLPDIGLTAAELYNEGVKWEEQWKKEDQRLQFINSVFYYTRAALYGDYKSMIAMVSIYNDYYHWEKEEFIKDKYYQFISFRNFCSNLTEIKAFEQFKPFIDSVNEQCEIAEKEIEAAYDRYKDAKAAAAAAARQERRRQLWGGIAQAVLQSVGQTMNYMAAAQGYRAPAYSSMSMPAYTSRSDMDYLIDPRFAIAQTNAQDYAEYQAVRENYQRMGQDISIDQWRTLKGAAILNMKNEGYDIIAEMRKTNEENRAFEQNLQKEERQQRLERNTAYLSHSTTGSSSASASTTTSKTHSSSSSTPAKSQNDSSNKTTTSTGNTTANDNLDSKQQFKNGSVSSDDYHFEKHVTLYIRDGNTNRVMFSNKDLCRKGAQYFVKIDNKYYKVMVQGGWGFNSSIVYGSKSLYFNK